MADSSGEAFDDRAMGLRRLAAVFGSLAIRYIRDLEAWPWPVDHSATHYEREICRLSKFAAGFAIRALDRERKGKGWMIDTHGERIDFELRKLSALPNVAPSPATGTIYPLNSSGAVAAAFERIAFHVYNWRRLEAVPMPLVSPSGEIAHEFPGQANVR